jgi:DNA-binding LacI/PurR family transcriptional regulator
MAGVSEATVSHVMNGSKNVTQEVRERVLSAVETLRYRPSMVARGLVTNRMRHIVMLVDNLYNPHYFEVYQGAQEVAMKEGYITSLLSVSIANPQTISDLDRRGIDGVIMSLHIAPIEPFLNPFIQHVSPEMCLDVDYRPAVFEMARHLASLGHRRVAYLSSLKADNPNNARGRILQEAREVSGLERDERLAVFGEEDQSTNEQAGEAAARRLLDRRTPFTAVFAINDLMAIGAARALREHGLRVPQDVSLVGCDNLGLWSYCEPSLATIDVQANEIGRHLAKSMIHQIEGNPPELKTIAARYIPRGSVTLANPAWYGNRFGQ